MVKYLLYITSNIMAARLGKVVIDLYNQSEFA